MVFVLGQIGHENRMLVRDSLGNETSGNDVSIKVRLILANQAHTTNGQTTANKRVNRRNANWRQKLVILQGSPCAWYVQQSGRFAGRRGRGRGCLWTFAHKIRGGFLRRLRYCVTHCVGENYEMNQLNAFFSFFLADLSHQSCFLFR